MPELSVKGFRKGVQCAGARMEQRAFFARKGRRGGTMKPEYYCRDCKEYSPPDKDGGGKICGACGSDNILPVDEWFAEKEAEAEGER